MIANSVLDLLGNTPVVCLERLCAAKKVPIELFLKLEFQNPGGSHKARIAHNMIVRAEARGDLRRGSGQTIIEPTGGNTGLGLAIASKIYGYKLILVVPDNYSVEKRQLLELYGAKVILSPSASGGNSHGELASQLLLENPAWIMLNQQRNPANPEIHKAATGPEILADFRDKPLDIFVGGIGTGGHITGVGESLKTAWPSLKVIAVQPEGCDFPSAMFSPHKLQGLAVGLVPANLNMCVVDEFVSVSYSESIAAARSLLDTEGLGVGISTGANIAACLRLGKTAEPSTRIICLAYDQIVHYLEHFKDVGREGNEPVLSETST